MIVSWNWLKDYVALDIDPVEVEYRLMMAGLNHERTEKVGDDLVIDLEITSNRPDCLGHIGVAREIAVLWERELKTPAAAPKESSTPVAALTRVTLDCPELCYRYTARVIRGVQVGPSPDWLARRLRSVGVAVINNIVDITNYVLMECGQPLHAFDLAKLGGREIIVREAKPGELFQAIDHKTYPLEPGMCVIADAKGPAALGGVMGGAESEVSDAAADLLIEAAEFAPLSIRTTARKLNLHSASSYRFERGVDPELVDWASRRCCRLILELAGGELAAGAIDVGRGAPQRSPITLRLSQLQRILGIEIPRDRVRRILAVLGNVETQSDPETVRPAKPEAIEVVPPSWRRDLTREIDLIEEVARIYGYDAIPEDVSVPMAPSHRRDDDRVLALVQHVLTAAGFDEAMTASVVHAEWENAFSPWTGAAPLQCSTPLLKGADRLRRSLAPSLLDARRLNESLANPVIELFETARIYLPGGGGELPVEQWTLAVASGGDYYHLKGVLEGLVAAVNPSLSLEAVDARQDILDPARSSELRLAGQRWGFLGEVSPAGLKQFGLRSRATVAELNLAVLAGAAELIRQYVEQSPYPAIARDLNLVVDEPVRWADLAATVRRAAGDCLENLQYQETYRDPKKDGPSKKRLLFSITLRSKQRTLTGEEADQIRQAVVDACQQQHGAALLV